MEYFDARDILSQKTKDILAKNTKQLTEDEKILQEYCQEYYIGWCEEIDGKIPKDIGQTLNKEFENSDGYTLFIHRTGRGESKEIFEHGLRISSGNEIEKTASSYKNNDDEKILFFASLVTAYSYKNSERCIVLKIPNTALQYTPGETKPILKETDDIAEDAFVFKSDQTQTILLPEYILGAVELDGKNVKSFERNPNYKEIHNYKNDGLVCEGGAIDGYLQKHMNEIKVKSKISENTNSFKKVTEIYKLQKQKANELIIKENDKYMKKHTRNEKEIKQYSKKDILFSKFNQMANKIRNFFTKDKIKEGENPDVDREQ